jgi:short-subunit dehydrogenase
MSSLSRIRALVTGGAGGIGTAIAEQLLSRGASVLLVDRDPAALDAASRRFSAAGLRLGTFVGDLTQAGDRARLVEQAGRWHGGVNALVNNAGVNHFGMFESQEPAQVELALAVNVQAPILLCRELLPQLARHDEAHIVNMGSVFGSIGYPGYAVYSATKFALRGFTEALRRELAGSSVQVHYLAPRATRTRINAAAVERMNAELGVAMDDPSVVGVALCRMLERGQAFAVVGWPEKLFARINAVLPGAVDGALRKQLPVIRRYAGGG